jgi:hypothetical protein
MLSGVITTYVINGTAYSSYILGNRITRIKKMVNQRGLNESVESQVMDIKPMPDYQNLSDNEFMEMLPEIIHTATFLSFIALKANTITVEDVLGDEGVLHELTHLNANLPDVIKNPLLA